MLFHSSNYSGVLFVEQRYNSVNPFEIFVWCDGAQGALEKRGVSGLFNVSSRSLVELGLHGEGGPATSRPGGHMQIFRDTSRSIEISPRKSLRISPDEKEGESI